MKKYLLLALIPLAFGIVLAQDKPKASPSPVPSPTPAVSLALTEAETKEGMKIQKELEEANASLEEILAKTQAKVGDPDLMVRALASVYASVLRNRSAATAWFVAAQKAHNCTGCLLEKGVFIKPEEKK